jgi:circadian clock protein KaiC
VTALKAYLARRGCTSLLLDDNTEGGDAHLQSVVNGVIRLDQEEPLYGPVRRRLAVQKVRAVSYRGGKHDFRMATGGIRVFPRLVAAEHGADFPPESVSSGVPELDRLLGGGIERGTATLVLGPAGTGKSAIVSQYVAAAARRGERSAMFIFDEGLETLFRRSEALGQPLRRDVESGRTMIQQIDPAEVSPGEFTQLVRTAVEREGARLVVVDTLNGYVHAMPEEHSLTIHLHELHSYLRLKGVVALSTLAQHGLMTGSVESPIDLSYLTDTVLMLRYFEAEGRIRKAVSVIKKRGGAHETALRELTMDSGSLQVGEPLVRFRGILTGSPVYVGPPDPLLPERT